MVEVENSRWELTNANIRKAECCSNLLPANLVEPRIPGFEQLVYRPTKKARCCEPSCLGLGTRITRHLLVPRPAGQHSQGRMLFKFASCKFSRT